MKEIFRTLSPPVITLAFWIGLVTAAIAAGAAGKDRDRSFDSDWLFLRADAAGAETPVFDDTAWRKLDVPHDWSIEDLPPIETPPLELPVVSGQWRFQKGDDPAWKRTAFDDSQWQSVRLPDNWTHHSDYTNANAFGWYRRPIQIPDEYRGKDFDLLLGCMNEVDEAFLNGERIGGTGSFPPKFSTAKDALRRYRIPASLVRGDGSDLLAVRVFARYGKGGICEEGKKSARVGPFDSSQSAGRAASGHVVGGTGWYRKHFTLTPADNGKRVAVRFDGVYMNGDFWINGQPLGNHPYGYTSFEFDLTPYLKPAGQENVLAVRVRNEGRNSRWYSGSGIYRHTWLTVIRTSHNPPSPAFLDACDRLGILVIDEAFDCWNAAKNPDDYHLYFKDWSDRDIASMVRRDRNHPSVVFWSIGNEISEQFRDEDTAKMLRQKVLSHDATRPITQAVHAWGKDKGNWDQISDSVFRYLDIGGFNYLPEKYESDHARQPKRVSTAPFRMA